MLGNIYYEQEDFKTSEKEFKEALKLDPNDSYALVAVACISLKFAVGSRTKDKAKVLPITIRHFFAPILPFICSVQILSFAEVGFESLSHFYALFKAHYEQTPRQFRRSHQRQLFHGHLQ